MTPTMFVFENLKFKGLVDLHEFNLRKFQLKVQEPVVQPLSN